MVQARRTSSNLLEPHHCRDGKVCRVLSHEFGEVRLYRTCSDYIFPGEARCAGCLCTSSGWFKPVEPPRTFSNHISADIARCVEFLHMSSGWFGSWFCSKNCAKKHLFSLFSAQSRREDLPNRLSKVLLVPVAQNDGLSQYIFHRELLP